LKESGKLGESGTSVEDKIRESEEAEE
jgi:hypothetical protein